MPHSSESSYSRSRSRRSHDRRRKTRKSSSFLSSESKRRNRHNNNRSYRRNTSREAHDSKPNIKMTFKDKKVSDIKNHITFEIIRIKKRSEEEIILNDIRKKLS